MVWLANVVILPQSKSKRGSKKRQVSFVQYIEVTELLDAAQKNLGCICVRWFTFGKMDHNICGEELKRPIVKVWEWYGLGILSSVMRSAHFVRSNRAVHPFSTEMACSYHWFYVNRFYIDGRAQTDTDVGDCGE